MNCLRTVAAIFILIVSNLVNISNATLITTENQSLRSTIVYGYSTEIGEGNRNSSNSQLILNSFDSSLGVLDGAELKLSFAYSNYYETAFHGTTAEMRGSIYGIASSDTVVSLTDSIGNTNTIFDNSIGGSTGCDLSTDGFDYYHVQRCEDLTGFKNAVSIGWMYIDLADLGYINFLQEENSLVLNFDLEAYALIVERSAHLNQGITARAYLQSASATITYNYNEVVADVPEPSTLAIFALGLMGLASRRFMRKS